MNFGQWDSSIHDDPEQIKRMISAQKISASTVVFNPDSESCLITGSSETPYSVTLSSCTCGDFILRHLPCKHIYRLASESGFPPDFPVFNKSAAAAFDVEAEVKRYFSAYKDGALSAEKFSKISDALRKGR